MFLIEPADRSESSDSQPVRDIVGAISESRRIVGKRNGSLSHGIYYRLGISIALAIHSLDLFAQLIPPTGDTRKFNLP